MTWKVAFEYSGNLVFKKIRELLKANCGKGECL